MRDGQFSLSPVQQKWLKAIARTHEITRVTLWLTFRVNIFFIYACTALSSSVFLLLGFLLVIVLLMSFSPLVELFFMSF